MAEPDLAGRLDRAAGDAWPAIEEWDYDGWALRFGRGYTKRVNSITPVARGVRPLPDKIAACKAAYDARHIPSVFRLPSYLDTAELEAALEARGYSKIDKTSVRLMSFAGAMPHAPATVEIAPAVNMEWLGSVAAWNRLDSDRRAALDAIVGRIAAPAAFALVRAGATCVAAGLGVRQEELVCLTAVIVDPNQRRRGFGRAVTTALLRWARREGAEFAYLQVVKSNAPAIRLYNRLGFDREIYRYHYRGLPGRAADAAAARMAPPG